MAVREAHRLRERHWAQTIVTSWVMLAVLAQGPAVGTPTGSPIALPSGPVVAHNDSIVEDVTTDAAVVGDVAASNDEPGSNETAGDEAGVRTAVLTFTGDVLVHARVWQTARGHAGASEHDYNFAPLLEPIQPWLDQADLNVCHLEVNLSADNRDLSSFPRFLAPGAVADDLARSGFDACSTASNHSLDHGFDGLVETLDVLDDAGLQSTGTARTPGEAAQSGRYDVNGISIVHLSYSYSFNGLLLPETAPWAANQIDEARILVDAANARSEGADIVILSLHWGEQYVNQPNVQQADLGPRLLDSPNIDLIIGHHAHVVQPIERINGEWLVYGVGNLIANHEEDSRRDELLVEVTLSASDDGAARVEGLSVLPLHVDPQTLAVFPAGPNLRPPGASPALIAELEASWIRTLSVLESGSGFGDLELIGG